ncbi:MULTISPECIES: Rrf2 family transcriptional regulator [Vagococcus]|uniref:Rrf2 family transcriptional regulator n=1 Tax=Vagococcus TaxID=2737 RepID=UPI002FC865C5
MKYSKATDYALHTMLFMGKQQADTSVSVIELAESQKVSPTYLSKILTKLSKEGLLKGASGAKGGYTLPSNWESITFLDIIHAIEGRQSLFECYVHEDPNCGIKKIMLSAEALMEQELRNKTLGDLLK